MIKLIKAWRRLKEDPENGEVAFAFEILAFLGLASKNVVEFTASLIDDSSTTS